MEACKECGLNSYYCEDRDTEEACTVAPGHKYCLNIINEKDNGIEPPFEDDYF